MIWNEIRDLSLMFHPLCGETYRIVVGGDFCPVCPKSCPGHNFGMPEWDFNETWYRYSPHAPDVQNPTVGPVSQRSRSNVKLCPVHNFALPDGILMILGTCILLMALMCRTQLSALSVKGHSQGQTSNCVRSITLHCLNGILMILGTGILLMDLMCRTQLSALSVRGTCKVTFKVKYQIMSGP